MERRGGFTSPTCILKHCEETKLFDQAERKYMKQTIEETSLHKALVDIIMDELKTKARLYGNIRVNFGFKEKPNWTVYPDIYAQLPGKDLAVCIVTNVSPSEDTKLTRQIKRRDTFFKEQGLEIIWFIERNEQAIEKDKNSLILWEAELSIASETIEDERWEDLIPQEDKRFFRYFKYPSSFNGEVNVRSLYYIYNSPESIFLKVQHFLVDRLEEPFRAFLLNDGYEISLAEALAIDDGFKLSNPKIEEQQRKAFLDTLKRNKSLYMKWLLKKKKKAMEFKRDEAEHTEVLRKLKRFEQKKLEHEKKEKEKTLIAERKPEISLGSLDLVLLLVKKHGLTYKETNYLKVIINKRFEKDDCENIWKKLQHRRFEGYSATLKFKKRYPIKYDNFVKKKQQSRIIQKS